MSPFQIGVILHYYARPDDYPGATELQQSLSELVDLGLLLAEPGSWGATHQITEMGQCYAEALTRVPMPVKRWVMPGDAE